MNIRIGKTNFYHDQVGVFDIMNFLPEGFKQVDGLISLKTFENLLIYLDFDKNKIIVEN